MTRYFEKRPTGGEDMAFWANVTNAERCRSIAKSLRSRSLSTQQPMGEVRDDQVKKIAYSLCMHKELRITLGQMAFIEEAVRSALTPIRRAANE